MASELERVIRIDREPGAGAPDGSGYDPQDSLGVFKAMRWAVPLSLWLWWVIWLAWKAL
jgi:hypothetical protein